MKTMQISTEELRQSFSGEMEYILFFNNDWLWKTNDQSCEVDSVLIKMKGRDTFFCLTSDNGLLSVEEVDSFDPDLFSLKHTPPRGAHISFVSAEFSEDGAEGLKFRYGDRYLFFFAMEENWLVVTVSQWDIFEEDDTPVSEEDDSELLLEDI